MKKILTLIVICLISIPESAAREPLLGIFRENFITTGIPLNTKPGWDTNDLLYQVSIRLNAFQDVKGKNWDIFAGYTQLSVWDIYRPSNPFRSNTYSPGLYAWHGIKDSDGKCNSELLIGLEHRSNGLDNSVSRSMNYLMGSYTKVFREQFSVQVNGRLGIGSIGNDFSLQMFSKYNGFISVAAGYTSKDKRLTASLALAPLFSDILGNIAMECSYRLARDIDWFYVTARYHYGYDENQLDCANPDAFLKHMVRFGVSVKPSKPSHRLSCLVN